MRIASSAASSERLERTSDLGLGILDRLAGLARHQLREGLRHRARSVRRRAAASAARSYAGIAAHLRARLDRGSRRRLDIGERGDRRGADHVAAVRIADLDGALRAHASDRRPALVPQPAGTRCSRPPRSCRRRPDRASSACRTMGSLNGVGGSCQVPVPGGLTLSSTCTSSRQGLPSASAWRNASPSWSECFTVIPSTP